MSERVQSKGPPRYQAAHSKTMDNRDIDATRRTLSIFEAERPTNLKMKAPYDRALSVMRARLAELILVAQENTNAKDRLVMLQSIQEVRGACLSCDPSL